MNKTAMKPKPKVLLGARCRPFPAAVGNHAQVRSAWSATIQTAVRFWATLTLIGLSLARPGSVDGVIVHDEVKQCVILADGQSNLVLRLNYHGRCLIDEVIVRGCQVIRPDTGVSSAIRVGERWFTTCSDLAPPRVAISSDAVTINDIVFGGDGIQVKEVWHFTVESDRIHWQIVRHYLSGGTLEDTQFPGWHFRDMSTWTGGMLGNGGVAWCRYLETPNATYGTQTGSVTFWNRARRDCLRITPKVPQDCHVATKFSQQQNGSFSCSHLFSNAPIKPRHGLRRFLPDRQDLWAPLQVDPSEMQVAYTLQALNYDAAYDRGEFKRLNGDSIRELLNTIGRYGVVDTRLMGGNGWRTGWAVLHEQWFAQMGLALNDPDYIDNYATTLDHYRDHAIKPDGRVLPRWHHDDTDAMPGTFDPVTGFYECQWGYLMDSQPNYVICVAEQFDLTADLPWLRGQKDACERALNYLLRRDADGDGLVEMLTDSHAQGKSSDWIDAIWASGENALVNAELYYAMVLWADLEELLGDLPKAASYRHAAARLKLRLNQPLADGGFWNPTQQWYVYWRDKDESIHGDNLVIPVNFAAIGYGLCDDRARSAAILRHIEAAMQKEKLFHWPLSFYSYAPGEAKPNQYPFPEYENGDIFLSWGELGVRAYAHYQPQIAFDYVRKVLEKYERDGLSFQRYLRSSQAGAGDDILAGNCMTIVGLYRDLYGIQPKWNRLYLEPHLTAELNGTHLRYWLRHQWYVIDLHTAGCRMAAGGFSVLDHRPFGLNVQGDTAEYFAGSRSACSMSVNPLSPQPLELRIEAWPDHPSEPHRWTEIGAHSGTKLRRRLFGLEPGTMYRLVRNGKAVTSVRVDMSGQMVIESTPEDRSPQRFELVAETSRKATR